MFTVSRDWTEGSELEAIWQDVSGILKRGERGVITIGDGECVTFGDSNQCDYQLHTNEKID